MINTDLEKIMISKLKAECGSGFTSKLEGMFTDINISKELMTEFKQYPELSDYKIDMTVHVLTTGTWPNFTPIDINLPNIVSKQQNLFFFILFIDILSVVCYRTKYF